MTSKWSKIRAWEVMATLHVGHIEFKFDLRPLVWYMPFMVVSPKVHMHGRSVEGGTFNLYIACFRFWTFRTSYFGLGVDFAISRNPFFGRLSTWRKNDNVIIDLQKKNKTKPTRAVKPS